MAERDLTSTLNLPRTPFAMQANLLELEPRLLSWWKSQRVFSAMGERGNKAKAFTLQRRVVAEHQPADALNMVLADIAVKSQSLAGLAAEGVSGPSVAGDAHSALDEFEPLGVFLGESVPAPALIQAPLRCLARLVEAGSVVCRARPVPWCVFGQVPLAPDELEFRAVSVSSVFLALRAEAALEDRFPFLIGKTVELVVSTPMGWTLPAARALGAHPDVEYVFYGLEDERVVVLAKALLLQVLGELWPDQLEMRQARLGAATVGAAALSRPTRLLGFALGEELEGVRVTHPLDGKALPIVLSRHVPLEVGTGFSLVAPGHSPSDCELALRHGLELTCPVSPDGRYDGSVGPALAGQSIFEATEIVMRLVAEAGAWLGASEHPTTVRAPYRREVGTAVVYRLASEWVIPLDHAGLRQRALEVAAKHVRWVPERAQTRVAGLLSSCSVLKLSAKHGDGVPFPSLACSACGHGVLEPEVIARAAEFMAAEGVGAWLQRPWVDLRAEGDGCPSCGAKALKKETAVISARFADACVLAATSKDIDVASDADGGWLADSLVLAAATRAPALFRTGWVHGFSRKSAAAEPGEGRPGADLVRLWVASLVAPAGVRPTPEQWKGVVCRYRKLRNTLRFGLGTLFDFDPQRHALAELCGIDQWVLSRFENVVAVATQAYARFEFHRVIEAALDFCGHDLSSTYFQIQKDALYASRPNDPKRRSAQTALARVVRGLTVLLAPILSFTSEEAYACLPGRRAVSVFLEDFPVPAGGLQPWVVADMSRLFDLRRAVLPKLEAARRAKVIGPSRQAMVHLRAPPALEAVLERHAGNLAEVLGVSEVELGPSADSLDITVSATTAARCERCENFSVRDSGALCLRCRQALQS
jgi:isoleucyl-tRNA synthetase